MNAAKCFKLTMVKEEERIKSVLEEEFNEVMASIEKEVNKGFYSTISEFLSDDVKTRLCELGFIIEFRNFGSPRGYWRISWNILEEGGEK